MCITFFCLKPKNSTVDFLMGFNRDEKTKRETEIFAPFEEDSNVFAGKDKISSGTWLGVNVKTGIMVFLTNYDFVNRIGKSRGKLVLSLLLTSSYQGLSVQEYNQSIKQRLCTVLAQRLNYSPFNLIVYNIQSETMFYISSEMTLNHPRVLEKGYSYGMCNGPLDELWQKTKHGLDKFEKIVNSFEQAENKQKCFFQETLNLLQDQVAFDQDPEKQASIFINPYFSISDQTEKMTKCSFMCVVQKNQESQYEITMKQVTYTSPTSPNLKQNEVFYRILIGKEYKEEMHKGQIKQDKSGNIFCNT